MFHLWLLVGLFSLGICLHRQYHFIDQNKTWAEARTYCRENHKDLVSIHNFEEQLAVTFLTGTLEGSRAWIGLNDDLNGWKWSLGDDAFYKEGERSFRNWYIHKTWNWNEGNRCVYFEVSAAVWTVDSCSVALPFVCFDGRTNASEKYVVIYKRWNWTEAQSYCREHHTDLISVRNEDENQKIGFLLSKDGNYYSAVWIGLYKSRSWSDRSNSSFSYWIPGEPLDYKQGGYCAAVSYIDSGKWMAQNCSGVLPFLCYSAPSASSRQYHFINEKKTWIEAQTHCRENFTDLATIDNMEEMNTLLNTSNKNYSGLAWIGLYDNVDSWRWSLGDDAFYKEEERDFRGWAHQPDNANKQELCVSMNPRGEWFDTSCTSRKAFVCYNGTTNTYAMIYKEITWVEAQRYCRANHRDLASVRNKTELQQIMNITKGYEVWIGLYRERLWSDQSSLSYTNRNPVYVQREVKDGFESDYRYSEIPHQNKHCTSVDPYGTWRDEYCLARLPFICYSTFTPAAVMGLQIKIKALGNPPYSDVGKMLLTKLKQELIKSNTSSNIVLNVRKIQDLHGKRGY